MSTNPAETVAEEAADQRVIEAQGGCMRELRRPCIERPNQK